MIPIAAVYFTAHYFAYLLIAGENTPAVIVDPFGHSWNPLGWGEYATDERDRAGGLVWWIQVLLIVCGHVVAVFAAHRLALRSSTRARALAHAAAARRPDGRLHGGRALGARAADQGVTTHAISCSC